VSALLFALAVQEGTLDLLDGETLYDGGWLFALSAEAHTKDGLLHGTDRRGDPLDRRQVDEAALLAVHYGLRYDLQLTAMLPYVDRTLTLDDPSGPDRYSADGLGDAVLAAKWRVQRWDAPGVGTNLSVLAGAELPTGSDDERDHGVLLPRDLQPGSGSWDPFGGLSLTHEPGRWRFNAFAVYQRNGEGSRDAKNGDRFAAEIAAGNRFWLHPYPGPFMRADLMLRYRWEDRDRVGGHDDPDSGGEQVSVAVNWAFRPRPILDLQLSVEVPVWQSLEGAQLKDEVTVFLIFGYRI
jgi:hypothetical protein